MVTIGEIASSEARLTIASLICERPRTLGELSELTHISVQGVLKHLNKLSEAGILSQDSIPSGEYLRNRKVYSIRSRMVLDYSEGDLIVAALGKPDEADHGHSRASYSELESLAQDLLILRRRVREQSRKVKRTVDHVVNDEVRLTRLIGALGLTPEEKQIAYLVFTEDTVDGARKVLKRHYGCKEPMTAVAQVSEKIRRMTGL